MLSIGLRFQRRDAMRLRALAERVKRGEAPGSVSVFEQAARAAASGEPLVVMCERPDEAAQIAQGYTLYGVNRPAVEDLTPRAA